MVRMSNKCTTLALGAKLDVTVLIAAKNEEPNIQRCLAACRPAKAVYVVDSESSDRTREIAELNGSTVFQFEWLGGYPKKRQWALENLNFETKWILLLDADEEVPDQLWTEIATRIDDESCPEAFFIKKEFHFLGEKFIHGDFSHWALLLITRENCRFEQLNDSEASGLDMEVHERVLADDASLGYLYTPLIHQDFKGLKAYISRHNAYSTWEAELRAHYFTSGSYGVDAIRPSLWGDPQERKRFLKFLIIRIPFEPLIWFCYHYMLRLGFMHGRAGWIASRMRATYIADVRAKVYEIMRARDGM